MKALTVQQPWAWAIIHGGKLVENRHSMWRYRGPLAIHAGARWSPRGGSSPLVLDAFRPFLGGLSQFRSSIDPAEHRDRLAFRAIIGVVDLVDAHPAAGCCAPWGEDEYFDPTVGHRRVDVVHYVLERPRALEVPFDCRGALGLWNVPDDVAARLT